MAPEDFERLILPHLDAAYNLAPWLLRDRADFEDVVQEAMIRAQRYFSGFRGRNERAWLLQIVRNTALAALKDRPDRRFVPIDDGTGEDDAAAIQLADPGDDPEAALMRGQAHRRMDELLAGLPVDLREAIVLRELEELSYAEIARITEVPIGTVMSRLWRARRVLQRAAVRGEAP